MEEGYKVIHFVDPKSIENKKEPNKFGRLFADLEEGISQLEQLTDRKMKPEIVDFLELLEKINDEELKKTKEEDLFFVKEMIGKNINDIEKLIKKYEIYTDPEKKIKENNLAKIKEIKEHCKEYIRQA